MTILVDGDACPVKQIIVEEAQKRGIPVVMVCDTSHELRDGYSEVVTVDKGADSADYALINRIKPGDTVVTQDYGVAAMALSKGAVALHQDGFIYNNDTIDELLFKRHLGQKIRRSGGRTKGHKKRDRSLDELFRQKLIELIET